MRVMNEPVQDRISKSGVGDSPMPLVYRDLCCDQGGSVAEAIIEDFENVLRILDRDGIPHPVIQDQQAASGKGT